MAGNSASVKKLIISYVRYESGLLQGAASEGSAQEIFYSGHSDDNLFSIYLRK